MLKIRQLFVILTRTSYDLLMIKSLLVIMLKLSADKKKDESKAANKGRKRIQRSKVSREAGRKQIKEESKYQIS